MTELSNFKTFIRGVEGRKSEKGIVQFLRNVKESRSYSKVEYYQEGAITDLLFLINTEVSFDIIRVIRSTMVIESYMASYILDSLNESNL